MTTLTAKPVTKNQRATHRMIRQHLIELRAVCNMTNAQQLDLVESLPEDDAMRVRAELALTRFLDCDGDDKEELSALNRAWLDALVMCRRRIQ
jgi:hypothetical protein